jgi:hypothetical protein
MIVRGPEAAEPTTACTNEGTEDPLHIMTISAAIIIYNMALTYHRTGQSASQSQYLLTAMQLYEKSMLLLEPIQDLHQGMLAVSCRMVLTASLHNLNQIRLYDGLEIFCSPSGASAA